MERAAFFSAFQGKKLKGVCFCSIAIYGNASTRMSEIVPSNGTYAYGGWPDVDELFQEAARRNRPGEARAMLHEMQKILHERTRFALIWDYFWPSGIGPRVEEASLMKIDPFPWAAPLEDVKLKTQQHHRGTRSSCPDLIRRIFGMAARWPGQARP